MRETGAVPPRRMSDCSAMALTDVGCTVRLRLPRWDDHLVERLDDAGIDVVDPPDRFVHVPLEAMLLVPEADEAEARARVTRALRGWTVLLPSDFA
jgi:hypothetical protein